MGLGRSRSNIVPVSIGDQVITASGGGAICCEVDGLFAAKFLAEGDALMTVGAAHITTDDVGLVIEGELVAILTPTDETLRLRSCLQRGHRYTGVVIDAGTIRIWNET
jgi:hypothetical protein